MLTGENGILTQANNAKIEQSHGAVKDAISLAYNEWQIEIRTGSVGKLASKEIVTIKGQEEKALAGTTGTFLDFLKNKGYIKEKTTDVLDVEKLTGGKQPLGNGETTDVYKIKEQDGNYILSYCDINSKEQQLWSVSVSTGSTGGNISYNDELKTLKPGDYVIYDTGVAGVGEVTCRVLYDANSEYGLQIITNDCIKENGEYVKVVFETADKSFKELEGIYNNAIIRLNDEASKYINNNYIIDARCVGSNPKDKTMEPSNFAQYEGVTYGVKDSDTNYETDYNTLESLNILNTEETYWLASRYVQYGQTYLSSYGIYGFLREVGEPDVFSYIYVSNGYNGSENTSYCLRPVFTLKGDLKIVSGDGQSEGTAYRFN